MGESRDSNIVVYSNTVFMNNRSYVIIKMMIFLPLFKSFY